MTLCSNVLPSTNSVCGMHDLYCTDLCHIRALRAEITRMRGYVESVLETIDEKEFRRAEIQANIRSARAYVAQDYAREAAFLRDQSGDQEQSVQLAAGVSS